MYKIKLIFVLIISFVAFCFAQEQDTTSHTKEIGKSVDADTLALKPKGEEPVLGVVMNRDLSFEIAKEKDWTENYGALVSYVTNGSPAEEYGIEDGDIITGFDSQKVLYNDHLRELIETKSAGDTVEIVVFRDGKYFKNEVVLDAKKDNRRTSTIVTKNGRDDGEKRRYRISIFNGNSHGGGINWEPMWYSPNWSDINALAANYGFSSFDKDMELKGDNYPGILLHSVSFVPSEGGYGTRTIGGIYFSVGNEVDRTNKVQGTGMVEKLSLKNKFFGGMIGKRIPVFDNFLISPKLKAGFWTTEMKLSRKTGDVIWDDIGNDFDDPATSRLVLEKKYYTVTPSLEIFYLFTDSFGIHAGASYMYGFERYQGWKTGSEEFKNYDVKESPKTKIDGYIFTIGPWLFFD